MADGQPESLFSSFAPVSTFKRARMDLTVPATSMAANSFSYSSGLELSTFNSAVTDQNQTSQAGASYLTHDSASGGQINSNEELSNGLGYEAFSSRSLTDMNGGVQPNQRTSQHAIDNHNMPPSRVVHCRAVADGCRETDMVAVMKPFGKIRALTLMPKLRQALVEFESVESAIAGVAYAQVHPLMILGRQMFVNFSKSQEINRDFSNNSTAVQSPTNVLLFTIINAIHPVNVDTIRKICQPHAEVQRAVIFHKNGLQALVEFLTADHAQAVHRALSGCDIYSGCCTLKIDFSKNCFASYGDDKTGKLNVHSNTTETYDIELERRKQNNLHAGIPEDAEMDAYIQHTSGFRTFDPSQCLTTMDRNDNFQSTSYFQGSENQLNESQNNMMNQISMIENGSSKLPTSTIKSMLAGAAGYPAVQSILARVMARQGNGTGRPGAHIINQEKNVLTQPQLNGLGDSPTFKPSLLGNQPVNDHMSPFSTFGGGLSLAGGEGCVLMVYGVNNEKINCDRLFNLFCLYGNVVKVKILTNKPGAAMVQYTDKMSTDIAIRNLNNMTLFANKFQLSFSKHPFIADASQYSTLPDGSSAAVSYVDSRNNRFKFIPGGVDIFTRIHPPSKVLHYFNAPPDCTDEQLQEVFQSVDSEIPSKHAIFTKSANGKSSSGLLEFTSIPAAVEALIAANHFTMQRDGGGAFTLKLAFSPSSTINS